MTAQETKLLNAFETTLATTLGASGTTVTLTAVTDSASNNIEVPCYLVIEPDSATQREYVLVTAINISTKTITLGDGGSSYRYLKGSAATSGLSHASGSTIRYVAMAQHFEDLNDRIDANFNEAGTEIVAGNAVKDEDTMSSDSAVHLATQQSIKAYVDSQVTAQDLDFLGDTGSGAVDLDSQNFTIAGTADEIETSASGQTLTIGLPSTITTTLSATSVLSDGVVATTQSVGDNSTKVATTAYVDAQVTAEDLDFGGDTGTGSVDLDSQTFTIQGTTNEIETSATGQTLTIGLPSSITVDVVGNLTGNVTGNVTGNLTGNVTGDLTGNVTATSVLADGVTATTQSAGDNSTKVATTAYVDSISVDDNLTVSDGTTSTTIDLDTQTFSILGTASQITSTTSAQTITLSLPATINVDTSGNAATATTLETARTIAGVSFDGSSDIDIPIDNLSDVVLTTPSSGQLLEYNGTNWINTTPTAGDITGVTAGTNLSGGGTSGDVTLNLTIDSAVAFADQTASAIILKDYAETDVAVTSSSGVVSIDLANGNTGSITLTENITDIDFTNVPTNGVSTFTLQITQDSTARTVAINAVTVNGGGDVTAKTAGGGGYTVSTGSGAIDLVTFLFLDAGTPLLNALQDFS